MCTLRIRNADWKFDNDLKAELAHMVLNNYRKSEILVEMRKQYPQYAWGARMLGYRLQHFGIKFINNNLTLAEVREVVVEELKVRIKKYFSPVVFTPIVAKFWKYTSGFISKLKV